MPHAHPGLLHIAILAGRHLLSGGNPVVKELNILGQAIVPNVILPKPALSVNIAPSTKKPDTPKINITGGHTVSGQQQ
jgi:hypothetical protein